MDDDETLDQMQDRLEAMQIELDKTHKLCEELKSKHYQAEQGRLRTEMERNELAREIEIFKQRSSTTRHQINDNSSAKTFSDTSSQTTSQEPSISISSKRISSSTIAKLDKKMRDVEILKLSDEIR